MKKNSTTLIFGILVLCISVQVASAKTSLSLSRVNNKISKKLVKAKLAKINSSLKKAKVMCSNTSADCWEKLSNLMLAASLATDICGGSEGTNYDSTARQVALWIANAIGDDLIASGCGDVLPSGNVSTINSKNKKIWIIRNEDVGIG